MIQITGNNRRASRWVCLLLALALLLPGLPARASQVSQFGVVTIDNVLFRKAPDSSDYWARLNRGWVAEIIGSRTHNNYLYYQAKTNLPHNTSNSFTGYLRSDVFRPMTASELAIFLQNPVQAGYTLSSPAPGVTLVPGTSGTPAPTAAPVTLPPAQQATGQLKLVKENVNLRQTPGGTVIKVLPINTIASYFGQASQQGGYTWLYIMDPVSGVYGYVRHDVYEIISGATATIAPVITAAPGTTLAPGLSDLAVVLVAGAVLRDAPSDTAGAVTALLSNEVINVLTPAVGGWLRVQASEFTGYIRQDQVRVLTIEEANIIRPTAPGATATPPPQQLGGGYLKITKHNTNLRRTPGGQSMTQMPIDTVLPYFGTPAYTLGYNWAYVNHPSFGYGYVRSDCYTFTDEAGAPATATPAVVITPTPGPQGQGYVTTTQHGVNLRAAPEGTILGRLDLNKVLPYFGAQQPLNGYNWIYVLDSATGQYGYIRSDCYRFTDAQGKDITAPATPVPVITPPPGDTGLPGTGGYIKLIKGGVNLRQTAGGASFAQLDRDTVLPYYGFTQQGGYTWYYVLSSVGAGYIRADMAQITDSSGQQPVVTPQPQTPGTQAYGYIMTTNTGVNLRRTPNTYGQVITQIARGRILPLINPVVTNDGYNWYFVQADNHTGYLRGDMIRQLTADEVAIYLSGGTPPTQPTAPPINSTEITGYIITTMSSVNVRQAPSLDAQVLTQTTAAGAVFPMISAVSSGGSTWYKILHQNQVSYMLGTTARVMTLAEYQAWAGQQPVTPPPVVTATPAPADMSTTAVTVMDKVIVRAAASMSSKQLTTLYQAGTVLKLLGPVAVGDGYSWYQTNAGGVTGYIRSDLLRVLTKAEEALLNQTGNPSAPQEATYQTLSRGSTGEAVRRLQTELVRLNFLPATAITGVYTTETVEAVRNYQQAAGLFVDGIAGSATQHKLYGTVPPGTYTPDPGSGSTLYPVEKYTWQPNSTNQGFWPNGTTATLTDVKTGISWQARRWSGGQHADVEPLTAADTAAMVRVYGVRNAQEIADKNLWERRPVWVTVLGHTYAGSVYGVPHNYPAGDTTPDNNFSGQFCVHFINSRTHSSGNIDAAHMAAIQYAYDHAPSRK